MIDRQYESLKNRMVANAVKLYNFTEEQAIKIFERSWREAHSYSYYEVETEFDDLCEFINDLFLKK